MFAPDLEVAKRVFVEYYDRSKVQLSPMPDEGEVPYGDFQIFRLT